MSRQRAAPEAVTEASSLEADFARDRARDHGGFHHEAFVYAGVDEFLDGASAFIRDGLERDEPTLVAVSAAKIRLLREQLGADADRVQFANMASVGANPARIIPAWREFVNEHFGSHRPLRGIGEPVTRERGAAELVECHLHEALLNLAFADTESFRLLCPYDTDALDQAHIEQAKRTHPFLVTRGVETVSPCYCGTELASSPFSARLPAPPSDAEELAYDAATMDVVRGLIVRRSIDAGLSMRGMQDLVLAVDEMATNSVRHGGGHGLLRVWQEPDALICEVRDGGRIREPLVGRVRPTIGQVGGFGVWLANQVCDLVQIRSVASGTVIRLHMRRG
jgi:anti-sigma regulatory factor (Ser/Thr protein kinase)